MKKLKFVLCVLSFVFFPATLLLAQVTSSGITGTAKSAKGESLLGATVTAVHVPSGTVYNTVAQKGGVFTLAGLRTGGPYTVTVSFAGLETQAYNNIFLQLGEPYNINAILAINEKEMQEVLLTNRSNGKAAAERAGMSTVINSRQILSLPTIARSITDFTRATPQANGNSFGGRDPRFNNVTMDGANLNNNIGLTTDPLPGGGNNPVSLDAVEEISVSLAPYDVRQGNFTGGNIAAITKSGTNTYHGTVYTYWQNQNLVGSNVAGVKASNPDFSTKIYGASAGGPILKNKLFFFLNGEIEKKPPAAGITWTPTGGSGTGNISAVPVDSLKAVADYLKNIFHYDPGVYDNFPSFKNDNHKILVKINWNVSVKHKLTFKFSDFKGTQDFQPSSSGSIVGIYPGAIYGPKFSNSAMAFSSTLYQQEDIVRSGALELNSNFSHNISNQFLTTFTKIQTDKTHTGATFPFIDILAADKRNFISVGNEPFQGNNNKVHNNVFTITDNVSYYTGKHSLTGGVSYEFQMLGNMFMRASKGYYVFANINDFVNNRAPLKYAQTYSLIEGQDAIFSSQIKIGQLSVYGQDEIVAKPNLKFTVGIRVDKPFYPAQPLENPATTALTFKDQDGNSVHYNTSKWPKARALFSPRASFRYDVFSDKSLIIRGGTGLFTGRIPYTFLSNFSSNSGMYQYAAAVDNTMSGIDMNNFKFNPDPHAYNPFYNNTLPPNLFPAKGGTTSSVDFVAADPNYKFLQIWKTDLGIDKQLGKNWKLTVEMLYTKDINATYMFDANQATPDATVTTGSFTRSRYSTATARKINQVITGNAIVTASTNKGSSFVATVQVEKNFLKGFQASFAYTYTNAKDLTQGPGGQVSAVYTGNVTKGTLNDLELAFSGFAVPHRIISEVSYHFEYLKHFGTRISLIFEGANQGVYSYVYNGSINNQGNNTANLMYIPKDATNPSEIQFVSHGYTVNGTTVTYTAAQQAALFETYINQDPYLRKHRGEVADRNGALFPWFNRIDMKWIQEFFVKAGRQPHTIQFSADIYNVLNLLNNRWGIRQNFTVRNPLTLANVTNGIPSFYVTPYNGLPVTQTFVNNISTSTTWAMRLGLRYMF